MLVLRSRASLIMTLGHYLSIYGIFRTETRDRFRSRGANQTAEAAAINLQQRDVGVQS